MASIGHVAIGLAGARALGRWAAPEVPLRIVAPAFVVAALLPDLDSIGLLWGVSLDATWGHRGAGHSAAMAGVMALVVGVASLAWRQRVHALRLAWALLLVIGSHGFLDAMTESGVGVALAWPLTNARVLLPFQFVPKAPMGSEFPSLEWFRVMGIEAFCFSPLLAYAARPWRGS